MSVKDRHLPTEDLLNKGYVADPDTGCWNWIQCIHKNGYGRVYDSARKGPGPAHRVAARVWMGFPDTDPKLMVLHRCDNRRCINPEHLYFDRGRDNARDREERNPDNGEQSSSAKLTWRQVRAVRAVAPLLSHQQI